MKKINCVIKSLSFIKHAQNYLHDPEDKSSRFLQKSVNFYQVVWCHIQEDNMLY